jgi:hypothetical protein
MSRSSAPVSAAMPSDPPRPLGIPIHLDESQTGRLIRALTWFLKDSLSPRSTCRMRSLVVGRTVR